MIPSQCRSRLDFGPLWGLILRVSAPISYLGEVMVHKPSDRVGPIVNVNAVGPVSGQSPEITLKTHDGQLIKGQPSDFELASKEQYFSFVDGWLSKLSVSLY